MHAGEYRILSGDEIGKVARNVFRGLLLKYSNSGHEYTSGSPRQSLVESAAAVAKPAPAPSLWSQSAFQV